MNSREYYRERFGGRVGVGELTTRKEEGEGRARPRARTRQRFSIRRGPPFGRVVAQTVAVIPRKYSQRYVEIARTDSYEAQRIRFQ